MTELLYQYDSYLKEIEADVIRVQGNKIVLNQTIFHPRSGGVDNDTGWIIYDDVEKLVTNVFIDKETGEVIHELEKEVDIPVGCKVHLRLNWNRRYKLMRLHTAAHILSAIMYNDYKALITGGNITEEYGYDDYSLESFEKELFEQAVKKANEIASRGLEVKIYWLPRDEALKIPGIVKLASKMPPSIEKLRIVEIPGVDIQADGGPHVKNTLEIGEIVILKFENKGKNKKRLYFTVKP
ncbi:MAG: alanyl-tRNA editing protein AlaXM [Thermosphaera sp.]